MKKTKKTILITAVLLSITTAAIFGYSYYKKYDNYQRIVKEMTFTDVDLSEIPDGVYVGDFDTGVIYAEVEVKIFNHQIQQINLLRYEHERGEAAVAVIDRMQEENRLDVDTISGATNSSKVLRKAVENALIKLEGIS